MGWQLGVGEWLTCPRVLYKNGTHKPFFTKIQAVSSGGVGGGVWEGASRPPRYRRGTSTAHYGNIGGRGVSQGPASREHMAGSVRSWRCLSVLAPHRSVCVSVPPIWTVSVCPSVSGPGVRVGSKWDCACLPNRSGCVGATSPSLWAVCLSVCDCQALSVLAVPLSCPRGSCPSSHRAPDVAAGYGGAPSRARRRWRGQPQPGQLLHWQHRAAVASGVKWP